MASTPDEGARAAALGILVAVGRGEPLDAALETAEAGALGALDRRDRAFARLLVLTVLRRRGQIDDALARCLEKPLPRQRARERELLRLGAAQVLFLGTPPHAAVSATVALAGASPLRGLANAVLRRLAGEGGAIVEEQDAAVLNTPDWLWRQWCGEWGEPTARAIAGVHLGEPPLDLTVRADSDAWAERLGGRVLATGTVRIEGAGPVEELAGYADGAWWVQDAASALPARLLLGALANPRASRVADLCAAPGGKTAQLAAAGARVWAVDHAQGRLARVRANLARLGLAAEAVAADAGEWRPPGPLDGVLLDAPCTATGTIRRHPDIPWRKGALWAAELIPVQDRLLSAAVAMLTPGGVLVYCVCSLDAREGVERVAALLGAAPRLTRVPVTAAEVGGLAELLTPEGDLRTLPCHLAGEGGMDGFYAARLRVRTPAG